MNPLKQFRKLRAVPDSAPEPTHSAGDERPSLALVREMAAIERQATPVYMLDADALDDAPPVVPVRVSARPGDPTPIWDAVLTDRWWETTDEHPLHHQFEVALIGDLERAGMTVEERVAWEADIVRDAIIAVDEGWGAT